MDGELEAAAIQLSALIAAGEDWSPEYRKAPDQHAVLIKNEAKLQVALTKFFKSIAQDVPRYINWYSYRGQTQADYNVDVVVQSVPTSQWGAQFITVAYNIIENIVQSGLDAGQVIYKMPLAGTTTSALIQELTLKDVAGMVGKTVTPTGEIIDNPKAAYDVTDTVRKDIAHSIKTSMALGETTEEATTRVQKVIANPARAQLIAQTESVNAYQKGLAAYALRSGAKYKQWTAYNAIDICAENEAEGPIPLDEDFVSGDAAPVAHPRCRCGMIYLYNDDELGS